MAGKYGIVSTDGIALAAATAKTVMQLVAAANHPIDLIEFSVGFDGTNNTYEPVEVRLIRQSDAGTMTGDTVVGANDSDGDTFDTTAQHTATAEPTGTIVLRTFRVHPQTGFTFQTHDLAPIHVGAGDRIGLVCTAANTVNVDVIMCFVE